jgi:protein O-GlcNAc transferase
LRDQAALLVLTSDPNGHGARALAARFRATLHDAFEQVVILPRQDAREYYALVQASDVLLDPPYFGGVNTTYDGFSFGKPIVTCPSAYHRGRYTLGCYRKMGIDDCIAVDRRDYVELACRLGTDRDLRQAVSHEILERSELLFEDEGAVREHERLFESMIAEQSAA